MQKEFDIIVIGAGIAGASVAAHLASTHSVLLLEMEERPGYHSTGRSASIYVPNYGPACIRALTRASQAEFAKTDALSKRHTLLLVPEEQREACRCLMSVQQGMQEISLADAKRRMPLLQPGYAVAAILDPTTADIDVDLLHQGYLRQFKAAGGTLLCAEPARTIARSGDWFVETPNHKFSARIIIDAAGAWGDEVAAMAGATKIGLQPKRRSMAVLPAPDGLNVDDWPFIGDVGETWYSKPQSGKLLVSPADTTPVDPHDAYADDMALAEGIDRFQQATGIEVTRLEHTWGGLRSFPPDGNPVVGYDANLEGFFWLIGQGGYGIQTAPALSRLAASLVRGDAPPADILDEGLLIDELSPSRFARG